MSRNRFAGITSRVMMSVAAGLLVLSYCSSYFNPAKAWIMTVFGLMFFPMAFVNIVLLVWAVKRRSKTFFIPLAVLLPALFHAGKYVQFPGDEGMPEEMSGRKVRIVSYNVGRFVSGDTHLTSEACADSVVLLLKSCDADILCLQEFQFDDIARLRPFLSRKFKGYNAEYYMNIGAKGCYGNVTLSRFPVKGKGKISFERSANMALYTDYDISGIKVRLYNCHLESYGLSLPRVVKSLRSRDKEFFRKTEEKVKASIGRRPKQVDLIMQDISSSPVESFVCGDFNDNPLSYTYNRLSRGRSDSFVESGEGFGATYSVLWPMLRIDYILFPERFCSISHRTMKVKYSDHYPVVADVCVE